MGLGLRFAIKRVVSGLGVSGTELGRWSVYSSFFMHGSSLTHSLTRKITYTLTRRHVFLVIEKGSLCPGCNIPIKFNIDIDIDDIRSIVYPVQLTYNGIFSWAFFVRQNGGHFFLADGLGLFHELDPILHVVGLVPETADITHYGLKRN